MSGDEQLVVGLSANVLDPARGGRIDGIGIYTRALERTLPGAGITAVRVQAPIVAGGRWLSPDSGVLRFAIPIPAGVAISRIVGRPFLPGARTVEDAIDVYHATDYQVPPLRRVPVVATVYDAIPLSHPQWASARLRRLKNWVLRSAVPMADLVIAISHAAVPDITEHYGVPAERIRVIHCGVDPRWSDARPAARVRATLDCLGLAPGFFLFVGTLQPRKNVPTLLAAYDALPAFVRTDRALVVVGRAGWGVGQLAEDLRAREAAARSRWLDYVDEETLLDLYAAAGAFVMPSLAEGFGLPLLEALAQGLPLVVSDLPVFREVAGPHARYVPPLDAEAMASAMAEAVAVASTPESVEARRRHARQFDWSAVARQTARVYRELASGRLLGGGLGGVVDGRP